MTTPPHFRRILIRVAVALVRSLVRATHQASLASRSGFLREDDGTLRADHVYGVPPSDWSSTQDLQPRFPARCADPLLIAEQARTLAARRRQVTLGLR